MIWTSTAIKALRADLKVTQEGLARLLDVTFTTVNRWETGAAVPSHLAELRLNELAKRKAAQG